MPLTESDLAELAREATEELGIAGAQIAILHHGDLTAAATGIANARVGTRVADDTLFQVGSTTKVFTAALVMSLVEDGRIELDRPVVEQLPGFSLSDPAALAAVTPRHLMSMSSGIDNGPYTDHGPGDDALATYVHALRDVPQVFPPGEAYGYSNASTCVSGRLAEHVTGQTWEEALRTRILEPAGLRETASAPEEIMVRRHAIGHREANGGPPTPLDLWSLPRSTAPAGGTLCCTASDLVRFGHLFLHGGRSLEGEHILTAETIEAMQRREVEVPPTLVAEWWGLGPYGRLWDGVAVMGHSGTNIGGSSYLVWATELDLAVATVVNTPECGYPFAERVFREVFGTLGVRLPERPKPSRNAKVDAARLVGGYAMCDVSFTVTAENGSVSISGRSDVPGTQRVIGRSELLPLDATTFLPTNPAVDGRRGWALAFLGPDDRPASHLLNGFFNLRRVTA